MQVVILAGGSGTRFWPLSRAHRPKQLLELEGGRSLLQATMDRLQPTVTPDQVWICTTEMLADEVRQQVPEVPLEQILFEPEGRNTAAAIGWSVRSMPQEAREGVVAVLPADHRIEDAEAFRRTLVEGEKAVEERDLVLTLGIEPHRPETGYGYLELGETLDPATGLRRVRRFTEKPDSVTAQRFQESGNYLWNAGIFLFRGNRLLELVAEHLPELAEGLEEIAEKPSRIGELYPRLPSTSIDFGLMEKLSNIATLPLACGWSDLGSWEALAEVLPPDEHGNVHLGDALALDARNNLLVADGGTVAVLGVEGLVVVRTDDAVLVLPRERSQDVRSIVQQLKEQRRTRLL